MVPATESPLGRDGMKIASSGFMAFAEQRPGGRFKGGLTEFRKGFSRTAGAKNSIMKSRREITYPCRTTIDLAYLRQSNFKFRRSWRGIMTAG
jgi:hypothetical protein